MTTEIIRLSVDSKKDGAWKEIKQKPITTSNENMHFKVRVVAMELDIHQQLQIHYVCPTWPFGTPYSHIISPSTNPLMALDSFSPGTSSSSTFLYTKRIAIHT